MIPPIARRFVAGESAASALEHARQLNDDGVGAMLGDILASFLKRRTGRERGASFPGVDQLDFVVASLSLTLLAATDWFLATFTLPVLFVVVVITPLLHVSTNVGAYALGLKNKPW